MSAPEPSSRWLPVVAYALASASNQMLWLTFTPITTDAAHHYRVSEGAIGWLAEIFPLLYVVLALPAGRFIDRRFGLGLGTGAALTAAGAVLRLAGHGYLPVLLGQIVIAVAQPLILNSVTKLSGHYLRPSDRPTGIAVCSAGIFAGMVLALATGAGFGGHRIATLLLVQAVIAVASCLLLCVQLRVPGEHRLLEAAAPPLRAVWADGYVRVLTGLVCVGFGVFIAVTTWLQALLKPSGVSESEAGALLLLMVVAGVLASALLPPGVARRGREVWFVTTSVSVAIAVCLLLAVVPGMGSGVPGLILLGVFLLTDLPIILELAERRAGEAGATAAALLWMAGNGAGLVAALGVQALVHHPSAAFVLLAVLLLPGFALLRSLARYGPVSAQASTVTVAPTSAQS